MQASKKAVKAWSDAKKSEHKLIPVNGIYTDHVKISVQSSETKAGIEGLLKCTKRNPLSTLDGQSKEIGKFYYSCAMVDKYLRVLKEKGELSYVDKMHTIFMKRWRPWHHPLIHSRMPWCYHEHTLMRAERRDCEAVIKKPGAVNWPKLKIEFDLCRSTGQTVFLEEVGKPQMIAMAISGGCHSLMTLST